MGGWFLVHTKMNKLAGSKKSTAGDYIASFLFAAMPISIIVYPLVEYFGTDDGKGTLLLLLVGAILVKVLFDRIARNRTKKQQEQRKQQSILAERIEHFTKQENVRGFREVENLGWVRARSENTREDLEENLKVQAAELTANALTKFAWQSEREAYQAGKGPKGKPYYTL